MKWQVKALQGPLKMPQTAVHSLLDDQMALFVRSWGSQEYNQKLIEEVSLYMSSAQADIDVTSPFEYREDLSSLANKTRISLLLAHDYFYRSENKNEYFVGFEVFLGFISKTEFAWSSVGRFSVAKLHGRSVTSISSVGSDLDEHTLLPAKLLGTEKDLDIISGSIYAPPGSELLISSNFGGQLNIEAQTHTLVPTDPQGTYWYSTIKFD